MHPARLFIVCGLPGAGTKSRANELAERFAAVRSSADDWVEHLGIDFGDEQARAGIERIRCDTVARLLRIGGSVVVEWGTWARAERDRLLSTAREAGAHAHLEFVDTPTDTTWERRHAPGRHGDLGRPPITGDDGAVRSPVIERPTTDEFSNYDPMPSVRAGDRPGTPAYPYGTWPPNPFRSGSGRSE